MDLEKGPNWAINRTNNNNKKSTIIKKYIPKEFKIGDEVLLSIKKI